MRNKWRVGVLNVQNMTEMYNYDFFSAYFVRLFDFFFVALRLLSEKLWVNHCVELNGC